MPQPMPLISPRGVGIGLVVVAASLWATVGIATRILPSSAAVPSDLLGLGRTILAGPAILLICLVAGRSVLPVVNGKTVRSLAGFAVSCAVFQVCLFNAFDQLGLTLTVFLTVCLPPVLALGAARLQAKPGQHDQIAIPMLLAIAGLGLVVMAKLSVQPDADWVPGLINAVVASVAFVVLSFCTRALARDLPPMLVAGWGLTSTGALLAVAVAAKGGLDSLGLALWDQNAVVLMAYLAAFPTALAYVCFCAGMARCGSALSGLMATMVEPGVAALLAAALIGERLTMVELAGCLLMALAVIALSRADPETAPAPPNARGAVAL